MAKGRKINIFVFAKFQAFFAMLLGFFAGVLYSFAGLFLDIFVSIHWISPTLAETSGLSYGTLLAFGALIGMPAIFALFGYLAGIIEACLYNIFINRVGYMEFNYWR